MEKKYTTVRSTLRFAQAILAEIPLAIRCRSKSEEEQWKAAYEYLQRWCPRFIRVTGSRVIYHGLENLPEHGGCLYVGNHESYVDIIVLENVMEYPTGFISKKELSRVPYVGSLMKCTGSVSLDRSDLRQAVTAMHTAAERLKKGMNIVVFPEGTRSKDGQIHEFHSGSIRPAVEAGALIVPFRIQGVRGILEGNKGYHVKPVEAHVYFGEPIDVTVLSRKEQRELAGRMREIVADLK